MLHTHSTHATALACLRYELPAFHYMVAVAGGDSVPCVPYHLFGTEALSQAVAGALRERDACLMANHGLVAAGATMARAMKVLQEVESLCEVYLKALTDRGTWLSFKNRGDLAVLVEGDKRLFNQYGVMVVNPAKHPHVKKDLAQAFADWIVSPAGQTSIAAYKVGGEQLFFPNAAQK